MTDQTTGQIMPGTLDVTQQPIVRNADGTASTIRSISIEEDGQTILIPTVSREGQVLSNQDAIDLYHRSGRHLGIFANESAAHAAAQHLHESEAARMASQILGYQDDGRPVFAQDTDATILGYDDEGKPIRRAQSPQPRTLGAKAEGLAKLVDTIVPHDQRSTEPGAAQRIVQWIRNPANRPGQGAMAGTTLGAEIGSLAGPVGTGVGAVLGAGLGGVGGALLRGETGPQAAVTGAKEAAWQAPFAALPIAAAPAKRAAVALWQRAAKPIEAGLKMTNTYRGGGTLPEASQEVAETVLSRGIGRIGASNTAKVQAALDAADDALSQAITSSTAVVRRDALAQPLIDAYHAIEPGTAAGEQARRGLRASYDLLMQQGDTIPIQAAQRMKRQIYETTNYSRDAADQGLAAAEKLKGRALRQNIATLEPAADAANQDLSRLIPARRVMETAAKRAGNRDAFSLTELITAGQALSGNPRAGLATGASIFTRPGVTSSAAQRLYDLANRLKTMGPGVQLTPQLVWAALFGDHAPDQ